MSWLSDLNEASELARKLNEKLADVARGVNAAPPSQQETSVSSLPPPPPAARPGAGPSDEYPDDLAQSLRL